MASRRNRRCYNVSTSAIINAIKVRPALYNKKDPNYYSMNRFKGKLWKEVCREVFENWDEMKSHQRYECDFDLQKRWKSLRSCFTREIAEQKKESEDPNYVRLRKKYAYFDQMSFLLDPDTVKDNDPGSIRDVPNIIDDKSDSDSDEDPLDDNDDDGDGHVSIKHELEIEGAYQPMETANCEKLATREYNDKLIEVLEDMKKGEEDEDRQFMLSLVPSMRQLSAKQKFTAKIAILKVLQDVTFEDKES